MVGKAIVARQLNPGACRTYLVGSPSAREAVIVDPVLERIESYLDVLRREGWQLRYLIDTHTHADHLSGCAALAERTGAEYAMHKRSPTRGVTLRLSDGATLSLDGFDLVVIETPGHTRDSVSLLLPGWILTGDWLFIGGAGRTDLPGGDPGEHWDSLQRVIPRLEDETLVWPAHDYQNQAASPLWREKAENPNLRPRTREGYIRWLGGLAQPTPEWMLETIRANHEGTTDPRVSFMPAEGAACMSCQPSGNAVLSSTIPTITPEEVYRSQEKAEPMLLLDVRQPEEYYGPLGHLPGAVLIPLGELPVRLSELDGHRARTVIAVCRSGSRSAAAADILLRAGFPTVFNMEGGTLAWNEKGYPVVREFPAGKSGA